LFVRFGVRVDLVARELRARGVLPRRIADHAGEVADEKNGNVAQFLESTQLADHNGVAQVNIGSGGIGSEFHAQWLAGGRRFLELRAQFRFANDLNGAFPEI
jgi:hypothetical protein